MRIALVVSTFPPYRGGMGTVAEAEALLLARRGHEVTVFVPEYEPVPPSNVPYAVVRIPAKIRFGNAAFLPSLVQRLAPFDAVHLHYPFFGGAEWVAMRKFLHPEFRYIMTYHMDVVGSSWRSLVFSLYTRFFMPFILRGASRILVSSFDYAHSSFLAPYLEEFRAKLVEVPFAVQTFPPIPPVSRAPFFLFVGGLDSAHYFKGIPVLLEAFRIARGKIPGYRLKIVGDGDLRASFEARAAELGIQDSVDFVGRASGAALAEFYASARALVLPSIDRSEAFGMVLLEALSFGTPVLVSDLAGVRSVATPDVGLRVPPNDPTALALGLRRMVEDEAAHAAWSARAREVVQVRYSEERYVASLESALAHPMKTS